MSSRPNSQARLIKQCEQFVLNVYKALAKEPQKLKTFTNLFQNSKKLNISVLESQMKLVGLIQDFPDLVKQLNQFMPDEFKVPELDGQYSMQPEEEQHMNINVIFSELHRRRPDKVQELITLIQEIKSNKPESRTENVKEKVYKILEDEPVLRNAFMKQLGPGFDDNGTDMDEEHDINVKLFNNIEAAAQADAKKKARPRSNQLERTHTTVTAKVQQFQRRIRRQDGEVNTVQISIVKDTSEIMLPPNLRNEMLLFEYLEKNISPESYNDLIKIVYLYTECVISAVEVFQMTKHLFEGNENYFTFFQDIIHNREVLRRKNTVFFKPLNEIDFKKLGCERTRSYSKSPSYFPYAKNPRRLKYPDCDKFLNKTWVSAAQGSEVNFTVKTRNPYEVNLFICEDERYEFDIAIYNYTTAVKWLQELEKLGENDEKDHIVGRILKLKVLQKVYANNPEVIEIFRKTPANVAQLLLERVQVKLQEIRETKFNQAKKKWHEMAGQNFHRALDHRSYFFKQSEKKLTSHKNFISDAQTRHRDLNVVHNFQKAEKYWDVLDTFEGLLNGQSCQHVKVNSLPLITEISDNARYQKVLPIFRMDFSNKKVTQDIFDILSLKLQHFHATLSEKEKISRFIKIFMTELINLPCKQENTYDQVHGQTTLLTMVLQIESKIYTKGFTFNTAKLNNLENASNSVAGTVIVTKGISEKEKDSIQKKTDMDIEQTSAAANKKNLNVNTTTNGKADDDSASNKDEAEPAEDDLCEKLDGASEEQVNVKPMEYIDKPDDTSNSFLPLAKPRQKVFYSSQHIYFLLRYYFTLYERFVKAQELAHEFEKNAKTDLLTQDEKDKLVEERYETCKWVLVHLLRSNIDNEMYEDLLRSIFGTKAYLMFYLDKIVHSVIVAVQKLISDDITLRTLNLFTENALLAKNTDLTKVKNNSDKSRNWPEHVYLSQVNKFNLKNINNLQGTTFFRFLYDSETNQIVINLHDSPYKDWKDKTLDTVVAYNQAYLINYGQENHLNGSKNLIFLNRNKVSNRKKSVLSLPKIVQLNNIEWKYLPNTQRLVTDKTHQEEYLFIIKKKTSLADSLKEQFYSKHEKCRKFQEWLINKKKKV